MQEYTTEYEEELYERIANETRNKVRLERQLKADKKKFERLEEKAEKSKAAHENKIREREARIQLDTEIMHQNEELERRALAKSMMADAAEGRPSFNQSNLNLLVNYQGLK